MIGSKDKAQGEILVVEDSKIQATILSNKLRDAGYKVPHCGEWPDWVRNDPTTTADLGDFGHRNARDDRL